MLPFLKPYQPQSTQDRTADFTQYPCETYLAPAVIAVDDGGNVSLLLGQPSFTEAMEG